MKALTIWQPWASLIIEGAKPYEFRGWRAPKFIWNQRIAIHAAARVMRSAEVEYLLLSLDDENWRATGLIRGLARPVLERARDFLTLQEPNLLNPVGPVGLPLSSVLGTAVLGVPTKTPIVDGHPLVRDTDNVFGLNFGWPLTNIERFDVPVPTRGSQGLWDWRA